MTKKNSNNNNSDIITEIKNNKNKKRRKKELDNNKNNNELQPDTQSFLEKVFSLIFPKYINVECIDIEESFKQDDEIKKNILISSENFDKQQLLSLSSLNELPKYKLPVLLDDNEIFLETISLCKRFITESNCLESISAILNANEETSNCIPCLYDNAMLTLLKIRDCINELQYRNMFPKKLEYLWNITKDEELTKDLEQQEKTKEPDNSSGENDEYSRSKE